jgi:putative redox protein
MREGSHESEVASVRLLAGLHFSGDAVDYEVELDADPRVGGTGKGTRPMRLLLLGLAGCTGIDVISTLRKQRQEITAFEVEARGERADAHPRVFERIELIYRVRGRAVNPKALERAIELSETRYCSATAMLGAVAVITHRQEIEEEP